MSLADLGAPAPRSLARPTRVSFVRDCEIVDAGVAALLGPHFATVEVVDLADGLVVPEDTDVVLYDAFAPAHAERVRLAELVRATQARVVVFTWPQRPEVVAQLLEDGAAGYLSKALPAAEIVRGIGAVHAGDVVVAEADGLCPMRVPGERGLAAVRTEGRPDVDHDLLTGLSPRESQVIALVTRGLSNQEIAEQTFVSINSVKTYIRSAYRKIGVTRRSQAVAWGMTHGYDPDAVPAPDDHDNDNDDHTVPV